MSSSTQVLIWHVVVGSLVVSAILLFVAGPARSEAIQLPDFDATFGWAPSTGPVGWYWTCAHRDDTAARLYCRATTEPEVTLHEYSFPEGVDFFVVSQAWTYEMDDSGDWSPCSDVYRFPIPVPEPAATLLLFAGLGGLAAIAARKDRRDVESRGPRL